MRIFRRRKSVNVSHKTTVVAHRFNPRIHHRSIMLRIISGVRSPFAGASDCCTSGAVPCSWGISSSWMVGFPPPTTTSCAASSLPSKSSAPTSFFTIMSSTSPVTSSSTRMIAAAVKSFRNSGFDFCCLFLILHISPHHLKLLVGCLKLLLLYGLYLTIGTHFYHLKEHYE
ncbi:hypothetical protein FQN60_010895, partial [Etheostoma spectabile]